MIREGPESIGSASLEGVGAKGGKGSQERLYVCVFSSRSQTIEEREEGPWQQLGHRKEEGLCKD